MAQISGNKGRKPGVLALGEGLVEPAMDGEEHGDNEEIVAALGYGG